MVSMAMAGDTTATNRSLTDWLGLVALLSLAWLTFIDVSRGNQALGLLFILFLIGAARYWRELSREPWVITTLAYVAFIALHALFSHLTSPVPSDELVAVSLDFLKLGFLPGLVVAYWAARWPRLIPAVLWLIPLGFVWRVSSRVDGQDLTTLLAGQDRATFGDGAVLFGLWCVIILLLGLYHLARALEHLTAKVSVSAVLRLVAAFGLLGFATVGLAFSQTRTAWGLAAVLLPAQILAIVWFQLGRQYGRRGVVACAVILIAGLGGGLAFLSGPVMERFAQLDSGIGIRSQILEVGWNAWLERPFLGWGAGADDWALAQSGNEELLRRGFYHLHNDPLIHLVEYGIPGGLIYLALFLFPTSWLAITVIRSPTWRAEAITLLLTVAALAGSGLTDRVLMSRRGPFVIALVIGMALAIHWLRRQPQASTASYQSVPPSRSASGVAEGSDTGLHSS